MAKPKPQEDIARISLRLPKTKKKRVDSIARERKISAQQLIEKALDERLSYSETFRDLMENISQQLHLPVSTVIMHMLQQRVAADKAFLDVFGPSGKKLHEFIFEDGRLVTGDELSERLKQKYTDIFNEIKSGLKESTDSDEVVLKQKDVKKMIGL